LHPHNTHFIYKYVHTIYNVHNIYAYIFLLVFGSKFEFDSKAAQKLRAPCNRGPFPHAVGKYVVPGGRGLHKNEKKRFVSDIIEQRRKKIKGADSIGLRNKRGSFQKEVSGLRWKLGSMKFFSSKKIRKT